MPRDERIYPNWDDGLFTWHLYRYVWALPHAYGKTVLDVGCGSGYGSHLLSGVAKKVVGVDYDPEAIDYCRRQYGDRPNLQFIVMDATALGFAAETFDLAVSFEVFEHITPELGDAYLSQLRRALRTGGNALISTPNHVIEKLWGTYHHGHINSVSPAEFRRRLRHHFRVVRLFGQKPVETKLKRFLKMLDLFHLRHRLFPRETRVRLDLLLSGGRPSYRADLSTVEINQKLIHQSSVLLALCVKGEDQIARGNVPR